RAAARGLAGGLLRGRRRRFPPAVVARLAGGRFGRRFLLAAAARGARVDQPHRLLQRDGVGRHVGRQRGVDAIVADIWTIATVLDHDRPALVGMIAERAAGVGAEAPLAWALGLLLLDQGHRAVEPDREHVVAVREVGVGLAVLHVGTEAADAGQDRLAVVGMLADLARQREEAERAGEIDVVGRHALGQAGAVGLLALDRLAELQIRPEAAGAQRHLETGRRILAELLHAAVRRAVGAGGELAGVAARWLGAIVAAADEAAEPAELECQPPRAAVRALARVGAILAWRGGMGGHALLERVQQPPAAQLPHV